MVKLPSEYSDKPVTLFAGMALMKRFIDQTGIREHLATLDLPQGGSNRAYDPVQVIESFWLGIWTGASRYIHCDWLRPGNTAACSNCVELNSHCPAKSVPGWTPSSARSKFIHLRSLTLMNNPG